LSFKLGQTQTCRFFYNGDSRFLEVGAPALLFAAAAIFIDVKRVRPLSKLVRFLADISFGVYLTHILALAVVGGLWSMVAKPGPIDNVIAVASMVGISIFTGWILHKFVENPERDFTKAIKPKLAALFQSASRLNLGRPKPQTAPDDTLP